MGLEMPAASAISSMVAAWKPRREKTVHRGVEHLLLAHGPRQPPERGRRADAPGQLTYSCVRLRTSKLRRPHGGAPMTDFDPADFANVDPAQFAQLVKSAPDDQLAELMAGDQRGKILDEVFSRFPSCSGPTGPAPPTRSSTGTSPAAPTAAPTPTRSSSPTAPARSRRAPTADPKLASPSAGSSSCKLVSGAATR